MNLGPAELLVIILFAFIIVGPERLPKAAKSIGKALRKLRDTREDIDQTLKDEGLDPESLQEASRNPFLALEKIEKIASAIPVEELADDADAGEGGADSTPPVNAAAGQEAGVSSSPGITTLSDIETFTERKARIAAASSTEPASGDTGVGEGDSADDHA